MSFIKHKKENPVTITPGRIDIMCHCFKVELTDVGQVRIYAFNPTYRGDVCIVIGGDKITLQHEGEKPREIFSKELKKLVFGRVFSEKSA